MVLSLGEAYQAISPKDPKQISPKKRLRKKAIKKRKTVRKPVRKIEPFKSDSEIGRAHV